jgi:hypothetical protein
MLSEQTTVGNLLGFVGLFKQTSRKLRNKLRTDSILIIVDQQLIGL